MATRMLVDATHPEETRVVVLKGNRLEAFDFESAARKPLKGNIYLAKVIRVEPSLQAAFVEYGGNRHGFLAFSEIHPDYYQIPVADRVRLLAEQAAADARAEAEAEAAEAALAETQAAPGDEGATDADAIQHLGASSGTQAIYGDLPPGDAENGDGPDADDQAEAPPAAAADDAAQESPDESADEPNVTAADYGDDHDHAADEDDDDGDDQDSDDHDSDDHDVDDHDADDHDADEHDSEDDDGENGEEDRGHPHDEEAAEPGEHAGEEALETPQETGVAADSAVAPGQGEAQPAAGEPSGPREHRRGGRDKRHRRGRGRFDRGQRSYEGSTSVVSVGGDALDEARASKRQNSFRHYKIQEVIKRRQILLIQVVKEERANKGAALTTYLSLAGRYSVLMPNTARAGGISRKIGSSDDRKRLRSLMSELEVPEGMGVIIRTAGMERTKAEIKRDYEYLLRTWDSIRELTLHSTAPCLVYEEANLIKRSIRDLYTKDIDEILIEGEEAYKASKEFMRILMPSHAKKVQPYRERIPLFHRFQVEQQFDEIYSPTVQLKSGGSIVINTTEALVAIDVNSGRSTREHNIEETAHKTNLEAADEVARQLRLRDLAGLIVIDFIDMEDQRNQRSVEARLRDALKLDRARIQVGRISPFGLLEMSRQRLRPSLLESTTQPCSHCQGRGYVRSIESTALHVLRTIEEEGIRERSAEIEVRVSGAVAIYLLNRKRGAIGDIETAYGMRVFVVADDSLIPPDHRIERLRGRDEPGAALPKAPPAILSGTIPYPAEETDSDVAADSESVEAADTEAPPTAVVSARGPALRNDETGEGSGEEGAEGRGRRRRRRRRRRGGEGQAAIAPAPSAGGQEHAAPASSGTEPGTEPGIESGAESGAESGIERHGEQAAANPPGDGEPRRRRRGHRGGRRRRRRNGNEPPANLPGAGETSESGGTASAVAPGDRAPGERASGERASSERLAAPSLAHADPQAPRAAQSDDFAPRSEPEAAPDAGQDAPAEPAKRGWWRRV